MLDLLDIDDFEEKENVLFKIGATYKKLLKEYAKYNGRSVSAQLEVEVKEILKKFVNEQEEERKRREDREKGENQKIEDIKIDF